MAQLHHPSIARVTDIDTDGSRHYFVMDYVDGQTLAEILRDGGPLPLARVIEIAIAIGSALEYAHGRPSPVVHRDITPSNVLIEASTGRVVVTDFGIARVREAQALTRTGDFYGKACYAAPEQLRGDRDVDGRADIYSLGVVIHEVFTGRQLFAGLDDDAVTRKVVDDPAEHAPKFDRLVPDGLRAIVHRAIAKGRDRRYANARELLDDLGRLRATPMPVATPLAASPHDGSQPMPGSDAPVTIIAGRRPGRSRS